jgi:hypothetical protein
LAQTRERGGDDRERHHQQTEQRDRRHGLNDIEDRKYGRLRLCVAKQRDAERNADEQRRQQRSSDDFHVADERDEKDIPAGRVFLEQRELFELADEQQGYHRQQHAQMRESGGDWPEAKPLDGVDGSEPGD